LRLRVYQLPFGNRAVGSRHLVRAWLASRESRNRPIKDLPRHEVEHALGIKHWSYFLHWPPSRLIRRRYLNCDLFVVSPLTVEYWGQAAGPGRSRPHMAHPFGSNWRQSGRSHFDQPKVRNVLGHEPLNVQVPLSGVYEVAGEVPAPERLVRAFGHRPRTV
jgi:hypothetical protein